MLIIQPVNLVSHHSLATSYTLSASARIPVLKKLAHVNKVNGPDFMNIAHLQKCDMSMKACFSLSDIFHYSAVTDSTAIR